MDLAHQWTTDPPPESLGAFDLYAEITGLDHGWRERMPILQLRQHLAVVAQFDDEWGAADEVRATLAPFRQQSRGAVDNRDRRTPSGLSPRSGVRPTPPGHGPRPWPGT